MSVKQRTGGIAALVEAATFIIGFAIFGGLLSDYFGGDLTASAAVDFVADNETTMYLGYLVAYIIFGVVLVPLALALYDRLRVAGRGFAPMSAAFGLIWAGLVIASGMIATIGFGTVADLAAEASPSVESVWLTIDSMQNALGGGNEIVGGIWVLLVSWAALRSKVLPAALSYLGLVAGIAGVVTVVPAFEAVGAIFGVGLIVWFTWLGLVIMREREVVVAPAEHLPVG